MTISTKPIYDVINKVAASSTSKPVELMQVAEAAKMLQSTVTSVATINDLPNAADNIGRFIWVTSLDDYRYSDGFRWVRDFNTAIHSGVARIFSWGANYRGQLGTNSCISNSSPVSVVGGFTDWKQVSAGRGHTSAVRTNGTLWAWGDGSFGQLGDGTTVSKSSPVSVVGGFTDWCQVSAGASHSSAIRSNGTLWAWGRNADGQLGTNSIANTSSPVSVVGGFTDWCQVSSNLYHTIAIRSNCTVWSWGYGGLGRLGDNTSAVKSSPVSVVGGFTDWCQASAGAVHSAAVRTNGTLWVWGGNLCGRLGDGTTVSKSSPVSVVGGFTDWCQVSVGDSSFAIRTNGTMWSWGYGVSGRLGNNSTATQSSPVSVVGGFTDWCQISTGVSHTAAIRTNGTAWAWGCNTCGRLGDLSQIDRSSPVSVVGGFTDWCQVSAGKYHTSAIAKQVIGF